MNEEAAFLHTICANPDEDAPRLVFADWLDEQGGAVNAAWAELIRVQIELARGARDERAQFLARRDQELAPLVEAAWPQRIGLPPGGWRNWSRGFPLVLRSYASGPDVSLFASANPVPLCEVEISDARDDELVQFLKWRGLRLVRELDIWSNGSVGSGLLALAWCEHLSNLERLQMEGVELTNEAAIALLESPYLARIRHLRLWRCANHLSHAVEQRFLGQFGYWDR